MSGKAKIFNIYCDESCHLEKFDEIQKSMVLGAIWCPKDKVKQINKEIRQVKINNGLDRDFEIKWTKISPAKEKFYFELTDYFFNNKNLFFRGLIIPDKSILNHQGYFQTHDEWYYKMYFNMLKVILNPKFRYEIYLDLKDTHGRYKIKKLKDVLSNSMYDFSRSIIRNIQLVRSHEIEIMGLVDLFIGALSYLHRNLTTGSAKIKMVELLKERSGYSLKKNTLLKEEKFNIFVWKPRGFL